MGTKSNNYKDIETEKKEAKLHICCDGECNHDDCCGKVKDNCPNKQI